MKIAWAKQFLFLLVAFVAAATAGAQETTQEDELSPPDLAALEAGMWAYFEGPRDEVESRVDEFLETVDAQIADLEPQNQEIALSVLDAVRDNFTALLGLMDEVEPPVQELPPEAVGYSIDELLEFAAIARNAESTVDEELVEITREQRVLGGAVRRRDADFKAYVDARAGDERWLAGLRLLQARSAQAISQLRLDILVERRNRAVEIAEEAASRVALITERLELVAGEEEFEQFKARVEADTAAVEEARERLRTAQLEAASLDVDSPQGRWQQRLEQQRLLDAEVELALAEVALAKSEAELRWTELVLEGAVIGELRDQALGWSDLVRSIEVRAPDWERQTEDELLAAQGTNRDNVNHASLRLLDQRVGTAQETLAEIGRLKGSVADLEMLMAVVDNAALEYEGAFRSWIGRAGQSIKSVFNRVAGLGDATLFPIGETPVTGDDILRFFVILIVALLLSKGIRAAISRVGDDGSAGTQASLYTVGRLTHYAIIIIALFIALSSVGLDFGSLALVAGALSVGIGFGLQSIVNNFVSGLIILFEHSLRVGDYIELDNGLTGTVKAINVRSTLINTNDNIDIVVPNSEFVSARLTNWTLAEQSRRVRVPFGVAYGTDKDLVRKAALEAAEEVPYTLAPRRGRESDVWLVEYGDSSLNFLLLVWVNRQGARRPTRCRSAYLWALETKLAEYGIEVPFPQRDLHIKSGMLAKA
ncbi:MAG: mechanosensitive ion channel [Woeseiaceae bacterium]|jgi:potassium efflux system protein